MSTKWTKSSHSNAGCLQISAHPDGVAVRDSKDPDGPTLVFTQDEWGTFIDRVQTGEFSNTTAGDPRCCEQPARVHPEGCDLEGA